MGHDFLQPIKNWRILTPWKFWHEIQGFFSICEKAMKCHFHGYFMASRSPYTMFHGSWIWKFSQGFHGIFHVFFMALRPWKCHWFNHENTVKNLWIYHEYFHKIFMGFGFIVIARTGKDGFQMFLNCRSLWLIVALNQPTLLRLCPVSFTTSPMPLKLAADQYHIYEWKIDAAEFIIPSFKGIPPGAT